MKSTIREDNLGNIIYSKGNKITKDFSGYPTYENTFFFQGGFEEELESFIAIHGEDYDNDDFLESIRIMLDNSGIDSSLEFEPLNSEVELEEYLKEI